MEQLRPASADAGDGEQSRSAGVPPGLSTRVEKNQRSLAGPALPDGEGRVTALAVAAAYRAVATAARGITSRLVSSLPSTGLGSSPQDSLGQHLLDPFPVGRLVELDLQHFAAP